MTDEEKRLHEWLVYIGDIAFDRDGYHSAKDLGELVDELYDCARRATRGEQLEPSLGPEEVDAWLKREKQRREAGLSDQ